MTAFSAGHAARALLDARRTRVPIPVAAVGPGDIDEAFAVQAVAAAGLGQTGAWKVGTGTRAPIAASLVRPSPCRWPASELIRLGIEVEIAFRIGRTIGPDALSPEAVGEAIASVHAAIEVVDSRFDTWPVPNPLAALADNQNNGGLVYDPAGQPWTGGDLSAAEVSLEVDGTSLFVGEGRNPAGSPFDLLVWLAGHLAGIGQNLREGDLVTTGSLTGIDFVAPGATVAAEVAGIGRVALAFPA